MRYEIELDTGAVKLWPGGMFHLRGETQYGETDLMNSGALTPVNTDALFPEPDENSTGLTEAYYKQFLAEWIGGIIGKISPRERVVFGTMRPRNSSTARSSLIRYTPRRSRWISWGPA